MFEDIIKLLLQKKEEEISRLQKIDKLLEECGYVAAEEVHEPIIEKQVEETKGNNSADYVPDYTQTISNF